MTRTSTSELAGSMAEIDRDHREFLRLTQDMVEAMRVSMRGASGAASVAPLLGYLIGYAPHHFATEERLMRARGFPGLRAHQAEHARFDQDVREALAEYARAGSSASLTLRIVEALCMGVRDHMCRSDAAFADFGVADGASPPE